MPVKVVRVLDGDSLLVQGPGFLARPFRLRLYGIDAPETDQPLGGEAAEGLARLARRRPLALDVFAHDRYGRAVGLLYPRGGDPRDSLNAAMVREGWAYCYHRGGRYSLGLDRAQRAAREARLGVWSRPGERPWRYRRRVAEEAAASAAPARALLAIVIAGAAITLLYVLVRYGIP